MGRTPTPDQARERMVTDQIEAAGVKDPKVLAALRQVPRHLFVPPDAVEYAYDDGPLPIGYGQTISQPFIVALMTELVRPDPGDIALEIGTGCGYQTAVLAEIVKHVYTIELVEALAREAKQRLAALGYANIDAMRGDGRAGWPSAGPFDIIIATAAPSRVPQPLLDQLRIGGRLVIPVGPSGAQDLVLIEKDADAHTTTRRVLPVRFVEMK